MSKLKHMKFIVAGVVQGQIDLDAETEELGMARLLLAAEQFGNAGIESMTIRDQPTLAGTARIHLEHIPTDRDLNCRSFEDLIRALSSIVFDTDMKKNRWKLWIRCNEALGWLQEQIKNPLYVITSEPGPNVEFIELEDQHGHSVGNVPYTKWEKGGKHWLLGPFLNLNPELLSLAVPGAPAQETKTRRTEDHKS